MAECRVCGRVPHERSCAVRLGPGWAVPPRVEMPGGPWLADPPPVPGRPAPRPAAVRSHRALLADPQARAELCRQAAELRAEGRPWSGVAAALGLPPNTARDLALEGGA